MMIIILIGLGLIIGSFLNAAIWRLYKGKSLAIDRSICPSCHHVLAPLDLIPVLSYIFLAGRCRYCGKKISVQYPLVESLTALSFVLVGANFHFQVSEPLVFALIATSFLILIAVFDLKYYLILDKVVIPAVILALLQTIYLTLSYHGSFLHSPFVGGIMGVVIVSGFFGLQYLFSHGTWIGFGDVKLGLFLGLLFGVGQGLMLLLLAYMTGAVVGIGLIVVGKKHLSSKLPFGTFLGFCGIIMLVYGNQILNWYLRLIGL